MKVLCLYSTDEGASIDRPLPSFLAIPHGLASIATVLRQDVLRRPAYSNDDVVAICRAARNAGIAVSLCSMMGLPGETLAEFRETVASVRSADPDHAHLYIFYPCPGTDLYRRAKEMPLFPGALVDPAGERRVARLDQPASAAAGCNGNT